MKNILNIFENYENPAPETLKQAKSRTENATHAGPVPDPCTSRWFGEPGWRVPIRFLKGLMRRCEKVWTQKWPAFVLPYSLQMWWTQIYDNIWILHTHSIKSSCEKSAGCGEMRWKEGKYIHRVLSNCTGCIKSVDRVDRFQNAKPLVTCIWHAFILSHTIIYYTTLYN